MPNGKNRSSNMLVKVAPMGSEVHEYSLGEGGTVADALDAAEMDSDGRDIRVDSEPATLTTPLRDGDVITLVNKVEGGRS